MKKTITLSLMGLMICLGAVAQMPNKGKYYRIVNAGNGTAIKENWNSGMLTCNNIDKEDYTQVWEYAKDGGFKNVFTGKYIQPQPKTSSQFETGAQAQVVTLTTHEDKHLLININGDKMHRDASNNVVRWQDDNNENNHWTVQEVSLTSEQVDAARKEYQDLSNLINNSGKYSEILLTFFTNELCTELKADYASKSDEELKKAMADAKLPAMFGDIAVKIKNQWWNDTEKSEYADANKYAKDFRVAKYQPYSDANNWREKMRCKSTSFMGNPTGIYATNKEIIHVFVGSDIPANATLYFTPIRNHGFIGSRTQGTQLKKGYNAIVTVSDSVTYFVNYVVNTVDPNNVKGEATALISDFDSLDIHIEGGQCVGYYQKPVKNSEEEDAKFQYLVNNSNDKMYFTVKGEHTIFYFKKNTYKSAWPKTIWRSIDWFDKVKYWEMGLLGVMDDVAAGKCESGTEYSRSAYPLNIKGGEAFFPSHCNNPSMAIEGPDGGNPHCAGLYTSYPATWGVESSFNVERPNYDTWCCGHEHGHSIQDAYNLESCTESSVNLGSQVINYLTGYRLSRGWTFDQSYEYVAQNVPFGRRDISITMRMYYNLYLYYHTAGKKKDFYPTFVQSLRKDPISFQRDSWYDGPNGGANHHRATNTWIKFYKLACDAAQEDLTEYFRMWGFFVPCDKVYFGDYTNYYVSLSQAEIDQAIKEVKAKGYPENLQIIFMEDRQLMRERKDIWASQAPEGEKFKPENWGKWIDQEYLTSTYGNVGDVLTVMDGSANTSSYTYIQSGNKITLKGKGGVGFIVYDEKDSIIHMSNRYEFEIPAKFANKGFKIKAINADGTSSVVTDNSENATDEEKTVILQKALDMAAEYLALEDETNKKVGLYSSEVLAVLKGLVADGKTTMQNKDYANYLTMANSINAEVLRLQVEDPSLKLVPNAMYHLICVRKVSGNNRYLSATTSNGLETLTSGSKAETKWAFVPTEQEGVYYIQNRSSRKLLAANVNSENKVDNVKMVEEAADKDAVIKVEHHGKGIFAIRPKDATNMNMHNQGYITVWGSFDEGSQWTISLAEEIENVTDEMVDSLITHTEGLIQDICEYSVEQTAYQLQTSEESKAGYVSTNAAGQTSNTIDRAVDGKTGTYFQSNNTSNTPDYHHLMIDLGNGKATKNFQFKLWGDRTKRYATGVVVYGSTNKATWTKVGTVTASSPLFTSQVLKAKVNYRYWRLDVVATDGNLVDNLTHPWFTVKELEVYNPTEKVVFKEPFANVTGISESSVINLMERKENANSQLSNTFRTKYSDFFYYNQLKSSFDLLYKKAAAIDPTVDIECIEGVEESDGKNEIYDLSGRKMNKISGNGVFIVNGKKVIK